MTWDTIELSPIYGADVHTCIMDAIAVAKVLHEKVHFTFNGYGFVITENSNYSKVYDKYWEWMRK